MKINYILLSSLLSSVFARPRISKYYENCWSEEFNIPCCQNSDTLILRTTYDGIWGMENGEWCGIGNRNIRPIDDFPPSPPPIFDIETFDDPAAECDISDSITGDSLAKEAPFRFGVGLTGSYFYSSTTLSKTMRELIKYQFNSMTYTNLMKPSYVLDHEACIENAANGIEDVVLNFSGIVDGLDFAYKNGIHIRGHVLVWHAQTPDWFFKVGFDSENELVDPATFEYRLESYIKQYISFVQYNYPGVVDVWDVVNEAVEIENETLFDASTGWNTRVLTLDGNENLWYKILGPDYVIKSFRLARKYALPNVKLVYNDYNTFQTYPHDKTQAIINLLNILREEDLVDAVGMQSYLGVEWPSVKEYVRGFERFHEAGYEIQVTELTISAPSGDDWLEKQAKQYEEVFSKIIECVNEGYNISSVTVFGLQDGYRFYGSDSTKTRLFDHDLQKKPNYQSIMNILKENNGEVNNDEINNGDINNEIPNEIPNEQETSIIIDNENDDNEIIIEEDNAIEVIKPKPTINELIL
ncbi:glycoside hydrolase [Piromyces finnis]|uniref:Beta-xylanase n=1 Tax=Piromyces finnis TaxID=1754191 RepID=A0A1Y1V2F9_9FUNG|nr:glycoside hydrolase [Piromyces finnis]|eukprot:ORX44860.1 glycoside hydrolase [Piromyces finnis]